MLAAYDAEADDFLTKPLDVLELQARLRSGERVLALQERLLAIQEALRHDATRDPLTGLWNRRMILERMLTGEPAASMPAARLLRLVALVPLEEKEARINLLRCVQIAHPDDFWATFWLGLEIHQLFGARP